MANARKINLMRWVLTPSQNETAQAIAADFKISPLISQILLNRRIKSPEEILKFLQPSLAHIPDPLEMKGMDRAIDRLLVAIRKREKITVYGDYDVDGTTGTALLVEFFQAVGAEIAFYIPNRMREGYSLNKEAVEQIAAGGSKIILTVDNGISAVAEAEHARALGLDLIITDHHEVPPALPPAHAILNPKQPGDLFPGKELAGVGVAYYLLIGLRRALREAGMLPDREPNLRRALDLVALGTIADMAPLTGLNRILVREGLKVMSQRPRQGIKALLEVSGIDGPVRSGQVAFQLGPRINAVGRLEDASLGVQLLLSEDASFTRGLAERLNTANISRKELEDQIVEEALARVDAENFTDRYRSLVVEGAAWHSGVIGIVASRLVEKFHLPSIVLTRDEGNWRGSARSIRGFNLVEGLRELKEHLLKFGGHSYAAGLTLAKDALPEFREAFDRLVREKLQEEDFSPAINLDVESSLQWIDANLMQQLVQLEPFGLGNPAPIFLLKGARVRESRIVGERHLKLRVGETGRPLGAIGFRLADKQPPSGAQVDLAAIPEWNEWNGSKNIQLRILDIRETQS